LAYTPSHIQNNRAELEATIPRILAHPTPAYAYKIHLEATYKLKTYDRLPEIKTPTMVVTGAHDVLIPAANSEVIAARIAGAKLHIIPDAGHSFFNEVPAEFIKLFMPFVTAHPLSA
jgi:pimeloyl-ACP methyl ester carboxylesterase